MTRQPDPNPEKDKDKTQEQPAAELQALREEIAQLRRQVLEANVSDVKLNLAMVRLRAEAMAMGTTDDLVRVVAVLCQEMMQLDIGVPWCNIFFM